MILIFGAPDSHTEQVAHKIQVRGEKVVYLDSRQFPGVSRLAYHPVNPMSGSLIPAPGEAAIPLETIQSVYYYCFEGVLPVPGSDAYMNACFQAETESALGSFLRGLPARLVNSPDAVEQHRLKARQLQMMNALGLRIPETLITNDPAALVDFFERHHQQVICKPMAYLGLLHLLTPADLAPEKLEKLIYQPVQLQEMITGTDIRVHVVGENVFSTEIRTQTSHYKTDAEMVIRPVALPPSVIADCLRLAGAFNLALTGIDLRRTEAGEYVYFEANPSPQFMIYEERSGQPISDALADLLCAPLEAG